MTTIIFRKAGHSVSIKAGDKAVGALRLSQATGKWRVYIDKKGARSQGAFHTLDMAKCTAIKLIKGISFDAAEKIFLKGAKS